MAPLVVPEDAVIHEQQRRQLQVRSTTETSGPLRVLLCCTEGALNRYCKDEGAFDATLSNASRLSDDHLAPPRRSDMSFPWAQQPFPCFKFPEHGGRQFTFEVLQDLASVYGVVCLVDVNLEPT